MLSVVCLLAGLAPGVPVPSVPPNEPKGAAPTLAAVRVGKEADTLEVLTLVTVDVMVPIVQQVPRVYTIFEGGKAVQKTVFVKVGGRGYIEKQQILVARPWPLKDVEVHDLKGRRVATAQVRAALAEKPTPVLVVTRKLDNEKRATYEPPDPFYTQCLREGTWVVVLPATEEKPATRSAGQ